MVNVIKTAEEFKASIAQDKLVVVDFFATWCGPCKMLSPLLDKFDAEYADVEFIKVDVDELGAVAAENEVLAMPTVLFFKKGEVVGKVVGFNPNAIKQALTQNA